MPINYAEDASLRAAGVPEPDEFRQFVRDGLTRKGISASALSLRAGLSVNTLRHFLAGGDIRLETARAVQAALADGGQNVGS